MDEARGEGMEDRGSRAGKAKGSEDYTSVGKSRGNAPSRGASGGDSGSGEGRGSDSRKDRKEADRVREGRERRGCENGENGSGCMVEEAKRKSEGGSSMGNGGNGQRERGVVCAKQRDTERCDGRHGGRSKKGQKQRSSSQQGTGKRPKQRQPWKQRWTRKQR